MARRLQVTNLTQGVELVESGLIADNVFTRVKGLLGKKGLEPGTGLLITPCGSIHSMWMRFRFDAVFISREGEVVHLIEAMPPWRASKMIWQAKSVLELPAGVIAATGTQVGDQLKLDVSAG